MYVCCILSIFPFAWELYGDIRTTRTLYLHISSSTVPLNSILLSQVSWNMHPKQHITSNRKSVIAITLSLQSAQASTQPIRLSTRSTIYLNPPLPDGI